MRRIFGMLLCLAVVVGGTGCGGTPQLTKPPIVQGAEPVQVSGSCTAELNSDGTVLSVTGTCNLMDGTNGIISVLNASGTMIAQQKITKQGETISGQFPVDANWPEVVYAFISFDTQRSNAQPEAVTNAYGKKFQNLEGDDVIWDLKGVIAVFQSEAVHVRDSAKSEGANA